MECECPSSAPGVFQRKHCVLIDFKMDSEVLKVPAEFQPNFDIMQSLLALDITAAVAEIALYNTGNESVEAAINFIFENPRMQKYIQGQGDEDDDDQYVDCELFKMVFIVNCALSMGVGKIAAQVGHAAIGLYGQMLKDENTGDSLQKWEENGQKKIVLRGTDHIHLLELQAAAHAKNIPFYLVRDAGHTQIAPNSLTVLSVFGEEEVINNLTGSLKLL